MVLFLKFVFYSMDVLSAHMSVYHFACLQKPEESIRSTGTEVADGCEPLCGCWESYFVLCRAVGAVSHWTIPPASTVFLNWFFFVFGDRVCRPGCLELLPPLPLPPEGWGCRSALPHWAWFAVFNRGESYACGVTFLILIVLPIFPKLNTFMLSLKRSLFINVYLICEELSEVIILEMERAEEKCVHPCLHFLLRTFKGRQILSALLCHLLRLSMHTLQHRCVCSLTVGKDVPGSGWCSLIYFCV